MRGVRGATTVNKNDSQEIIDVTKELTERMSEANHIHPEDISHIFISMTEDLNAAFPAKALRMIDGWKYVPVMCMREVDVPNSLENCIRIMMVVNTNKHQQNIEHIYLNNAIKLRPDLHQSEE